MKSKIYNLILLVLMTILIYPIIGHAETNYVAQIGTEKYETLTNAINAVTDTTQTTIMLINDVINEPILVIGKEDGNRVSTLAQNIIIDLNGYKIEKNDIQDDAHKDSIIKILGSATLTIDDTSDAKTGLITSGSSDVLRGFDVERGTLILKGGTITTSLKNTGWSGGGVNIWKQGEFIMEGGAIKNCKAGGLGGGVNVGNDNSGTGFIEKGIFTMTGGTIENCSAGSWGGGISNWTTFIMEGGSIEGNTAASGGGGITTSANASFTMTGGTITGNTANGGNLDSSGGGVCADGIIKIGGSAVIANNKWKTDTNNFYLRNNNHFIEIDNPSEDMNVGIILQSSLGKFTSNGIAGNTTAFIADKDMYAVKYNTSGYLELEEDKKDPTGEIIFEEKKFTSFLNTITFGLFFKDKFDVTITASDNNIIKSIEYYIADEAMTLDEVKAITSWTEYEEFSIDSESKYVIYAKITDRADNITYISSDGFIFDETLPVISGINTNNGVYYTTQKFTVTDDNIDKVLIDNIEVSEYVLEGNVDTTYEIDVYDKAGNNVYFAIRMMSISTLSGLIEEYTEENITLQDKEIIDYVKNNVDNIDTTYATDLEKEELQAVADQCDLLLDAITDKYISQVEFTVTMPRAEQTVADNTFTITSKYDDIVISIKEWKINGGSEALASDYVFVKDKLYIPILKVERKDQTYYLDENTTLTIHGSNWSNGEDTYKLKDHKSYGYVKELSDGSFIIDEMIVKAGSRIPNYVFTTGDEQEFSKGKISNYSFKLDADFSLFDTLTIDDLSLTKDSDFEINAEENTITFKENGITKLNTLEIGNHIVTVAFTNDKKVTGTLIIKEFIKETVILSGLTYEDKVYNKKPIEPKGTLTVSENKVPVEDIEIWYENQNDWTKEIKPPVNVGEYKVYYIIPDSNENYQGSVSYSFKIEKANPELLLSPQLTGVKGEKLSDVELPAGFSWVDERDELIVGEEKYDVIFTPEDTENYNILNNIKLSVYTKDIFRVNTMVDGGNGSITSGKEVIEGDEFEIELTPNNGYMINNLLLLDPQLPDPDNIIYIDVDTIDDNKYKLTIDKPYTVKVSYKELEYEVISGANQTYIIDTNKEAAFRINADYSLFEGKVYVDDILLEEKDYSSEEGSTIIKLKKEFVDTLKVGKHTLKVEFSDKGKATTYFVIDTSNEDNPKTGDNILMYSIIGSISLISLFSCIYYLNNKRYN